MARSHAHVPTVPAISTGEVPVAQQGTHRAAAQARSDSRNLRVHTFRLASQADGRLLTTGRYAIEPLIQRYSDVVHRSLPALVRGGGGLLLGWLILAQLQPLTVDTHRRHVIATTGESRRGTDV